MFAVVQTGGKQYLVRSGVRIKVEKLASKEGAKHVFDRVLAFSSDNKNVSLGTPFLETRVEGKVIQHGRRDKIRIFKKKPKKRYERRQGHKQCYSEVEIIKIG